jgi:hypothetical protein
MRVCRYSYIALKGDIPKGFKVMSNCGTSNINPDHLALVRKGSGRKNKGEKRTQQN